VAPAQAAYRTRVVQNFSCSVRQWRHHQAERSDRLPSPHNQGRADM